MTTPQRVDVARLRELLEKATPGPWRWSGNGNIVPPAYPYGKYDFEIAAVYTERDDDEAPANAELIIAAVNALPALLQQLADYDERGETITMMGREIADLKMQVLAAERAREGDRAELAKFERECRIYQGQHERAYADHQMDGRDSYHPGRALANTFKWMGDRIAAFLAANGGRDHG